MAGRREMNEAEGWALLEAVSELRLAGAIDGMPVVRTYHHAVHDGRLWLHGAPRGTLPALTGTPVQLVAEQIVARIPSWMRDPERACPATTFYRSVIVDGVLEAVADPTERAAALQRTMTLRQPEGRHVPIDAADPLYAAAVRGLGVWSVRPARMSAVAKLGTNLSADEIGRIVAGLWSRGGPGDLAAIDAVTAANPGAPAPVPVPNGLRLRLAPTARDADRAAALVHDAYWNGDLSPDQLRDAVLASAAWVGLERDGQLVATARAISDRTKRSWVYDVAVRDDLRRAGLGSALMRVVLDHPALRGTEVLLGTRDAQGFYTRHGFEEVFTRTSGAYPTTTMRRPRPAPR